MSQWFYAVGTDRTGPIAESELRALIAQGVVTPDTYVHTDGFTSWKLLRDVPELNAPAAPTAPPPAPVTGGADVIDYQITGEEMQFVEIELDPGESAVAEAGAMMYMSDAIKMTTLFGDGSAQDAGGGFMDRLLGAGKRLITGESLFITVFTHTGGSGKQHVAFAAPYPGKIIPMDLKSLGGQLICQKDAFLAAAKGVSIGIHMQKKIGVGLFGGEGFIMQKLEGDGLCFVHVGGTIVEKNLQAGEKLRVDTGCLAALTPTVHYDIEFVGDVKSAVFGGEGVFFAALTGPGTVWLQSLPFSRLAGKIHEAAPQTGSGGAGEGSVLDNIGGIGNILRGN